MTLEDEQSYLLGEKDHLLFTVQERKLTIDTRKLGKYHSKTCREGCDVGRARSDAVEQGRAQHSEGDVFLANSVGSFQGPKTSSDILWVSSEKQLRTEL